MPSTSGSRKRILLNGFPTYEKALAAKNEEERYPQDQLQIKKRANGARFDLVARISTNTKNSSKENDTNGN